MTGPSTTRMSSRGQVVIPEEIRTRLGLEAGSRFLVLGDGDVVILQRIANPSMEEFDGIIAEARRQAREAGLTRADVRAAVKRVRSKR